MQNLTKLTTASIAIGFTASSAPDAETFKVGIVTFLSGQAAQSFGMPAADEAKLLIKKQNAGEVPAFYNVAGTETGVNDGAAALIIASEAAEKSGLRSITRIFGGAAAVLPCITASPSASNGPSRLRFTPNSQLT